MLAAAPSSGAVQSPMSQPRTYVAGNVSSFGSWISSAPPKASQGLPEFALNDTASSASMPIYTSATTLGHASNAPAALVEVNSETGTSLQPVLCTVSAMTPQQ